MQAFGKKLLEGLTKIGLVTFSQIQCERLDRFHAFIKSHAGIRKECVGRPDQKRPCHFFLGQEQYKGLYKKIKKIKKTPFNEILTVNDPVASKMFSFLEHLP